MRGLDWKGRVVFHGLVTGWLGLVLALSLVGPALAQESSAEKQDERIPGVVYFEIDSMQHSPDPIEYEMMPPAGGRHHMVWQDCGFYDDLIVTEQGVHSQEHGAVWITYDPGLDEEQLALLEELATRQQYVLVSPFLDLPSPVVASVWGAQLQLERADDPRLELFIREFAGNGPEPGAPCFGGSSETLGPPEDTPEATPAP
jgi:hypothetical protein